MRRCSSEGNNSRIVYACNNFSPSGNMASFMEKYAINLQIGCDDTNREFALIKFILKNDMQFSWIIEKKWRKAFDGVVTRNPLRKKTA
jgi:hypothetical protein